MTNDLEKLKEMIKKLSHDPIWDCFTRAALEIRWEEFTKNAIAIVYADIDHLHFANKKYGHAGVDERIRKSLSKHRSDDIIVSRLLNGDEVFFILKSGNPKGFAKRILQSLKDNGLSATFSYTYKITNDLFETVNPLDEKVQNSKNNNIRGIVLD